MQQPLRSISAAASVAALAFTAGHAMCGGDSVYRDARDGFSIEPPDFADDGEAAAVTIVQFLAPPADGFSGNLSLQRQALDGGLDKYVELSKSQFKALKFEVESSKETQVGKHEAHDFLYSGELGGRALKFHALAIADDEHVMLLTCTASAKDFDDYSKAFEDALASFEFDE